MDKSIKINYTKVKIISFKNHPRCFKYIFYCIMLPYSTKKFSFTAFPFTSIRIDSQSECNYSTTQKLLQAKYQIQNWNKAAYDKMFYIKLYRKQIRNNLFHL